MWWVDFFWLLVVHQATRLFPILSRTGGENTMKKLMGPDKDEIIYPSLPRVKHT